MSVFSKISLCSWESRVCQFLGRVFYCFQHLINNTWLHFSDIYTVTANCGVHYPSIVQESVANGWQVNISYKHTTTRQVFNPYPKARICHVCMFKLLNNHQTVIEVPLFSRRSCENTWNWIIYAIMSLCHKVLCVCMPIYSVDNGELFVDNHTIGTSICLHHFMHLLMALKPMQVYKMSGFSEPVSLNGEQHRSFGFTMYTMQLDDRNSVNTLRPRQHDRHFPDDIFRCIFLNENIWIAINISLSFVPKGPIDNIPALVQIMAWRRSGDKPLSEPMMVSLLTHICVTRPQWVKPTLL